MLLLSRSLHLNIMMTTRLQQICNVWNCNGGMLDSAIVLNSSKVELIEVPLPISYCDLSHNSFVVRLTTHSFSSRFDEASDIHDLDFNRCNYFDLCLTNWDEAVAMFYTLSCLKLSAYTLHSADPSFVTQTVNRWWTDEVTSFDITAMLSGKFDDDFCVTKL